MTALNGVHLFGWSTVQLGGVGNHAIEVKKDGVVLVAADDAPLVGLPHRSHSDTAVL